ncbi:MAG: ABC transporter substrate-binding protein [Gammaproteobacteria bacterium]|nr:ABC transporter substrate-binding protein [Gammaproteobacteria bacterium]
MPATRKKHLKANILFVALALLVSMQILPAAATPSTNLAQQLVMDTSDKVLAKIKQEKERLEQEPSFIFPLVEEIVLPHFDFIRMSRWALGKNWRTSSKEQKKQFIVEFRTLLVRTYAKALLEYTGEQEINYLPVREGKKPNKVVIRTEIAQDGAPSLPIHYTLYQKDNVWKVIDIKVEGVSLVANYRSSFGTEIRKDGMEKLLVRLKRLNKKATEGKDKQK